MQVILSEEEMNKCEDCKHYIDYGTLCDKTHYVKNTIHGQADTCKDYTKK